jgi:flagellar L-ring protein precursor FlgH
MRDRPWICLTLLAAAALAMRVHAAPPGDEANTMFDPQTYRSMVAETKALSVGDVLTVAIQESTTASSSADLHTQRAFALSGQAGTNKHGPYSAAASTSSQSDGAGATDRSGSVLAQLSVRVVQINANGDLQVAGKQSLMINGEQQLITLSGVVRVRDIGTDNTVASSRIADARIQVSGKGFVANQSKPGFLARLLSILGL